jgi:hypothetical protein
MPVALLCVIVASLILPAGMNPATAGITCFGRNVPRDNRGGNGPDLMEGTRHADVFFGGGGRDVIRGFGGRDRLCGGPGPDLIFGGRGADRIGGQGGNDGQDKPEAKLYGALAATRSSGTQEGTLSISGRARIQAGVIPATTRSTGTTRSLTTSSTEVATMTAISVWATPGTRSFGARPWNSFYTACPD